MQSVFESYPISYSGVLQTLLKDTYTSSYKSTPEDVSTIEGDAKEFTSIATMSSIDIANLTEKQHKNVIADIRKMLGELGMGVAEFSATYQHPQNKQTFPIYNLPKRECLILVSGYSAVLRARIIDRWLELEKYHSINETYHITEKLKELEVRLNNLSSTDKRKPPQKYPHRQSDKLIKFTQLCEYLEASTDDVRDFLLGHGLREMKDGAMIATEYSITEGMEVIKFGRDSTGREYTWSLFTRPP